MPAISSTAPGKIILFGEHAVVYDRPAIAVPINKVRARATILANLQAESGEVLIQAPDINLEAYLNNLSDDHPLAIAIWSVVHELGAFRLPACTIQISSTIPIASGMGSGAAISVAVIRSISAFLGKRLSDNIVSELAYEVEKIHHGTPSGIDNTVITYNKPIFFQQGSPIHLLNLNMPFTLVIADTGKKSPTSITVGNVRKQWLSNKRYYEEIFDEIGQITSSARTIIEKGEPALLGNLMNENHQLLQALDVSSPELDHLVHTANLAGALGAKLSGGGGGGNMIALVDPQLAHTIAEELFNQGAASVFISQISTSSLEE
jgi:mevalonate kinase